jgi:prophage regulatory protein
MQTKYDTINKQSKHEALNRQKVLADYGETDRLVRDAGRKTITTLSRSRTTQLEHQGKHPKRKVLGSNSVAWLLSDLLVFINQGNTWEEPK